MISRGYRYARVQCIVGEYFVELWPRQQANYCCRVDNANNTVKTLKTRSR